MKINWKTLSRILILFIVLRSVLSIWMWAARQISPTNPVNITQDMYKGILPETNPWLEPWQRWDTLHYQAIAERGYGAFDSALFTPPLFPFLMNVTASLFSWNTLASGLLVSGLAFLACLFAIHKIAKLELGSENDAFRATLFLSSFPAAIFLAAAYSESLFILGAIMSLYSARKEQWIAAGLWGAVAAVTRIPGSFLVFPLAYAAWSAWRKGARRAWLAPLLSGMGALIYPLYVWVGLGQSPAAILEAQNSRGGRLTIPGWNILEATLRIVRGQLLEENIIELIFTILFIVLAIFIWKKLPRIYGIYTAILMLFFLARFGSPQPLVSMARYVVEIFPGFLVLAEWGRKPWPNRLILYLSWLGLLFFSAQFAIWGWVG